MSTPDPNTVPPDLLASLNLCRQQLEQVVNNLQVAQQGIPAPPILYHYTDGAGLLGILQTGKLRLSDVLGMNDPTEILHGIRIGSEVLIEEAAKGHRAGQMIAAAFDQFSEEIVRKAARFYIACFSRCGDDLGQWRAYGANGHGFAIGFRGPDLEAAFAQSDTTANSTISITYRDAELRDTAKKLAAILVSAAGLPQGRNLEPPAVRQWMVGLQEAHSMAMLRAALIFKHKAYENEAEYRFLHTRQYRAARTGEHVRARGSSLVWYLDFDWRAADPTLLHHIVTGPALNNNDAKKFVEECLTCSGFAADAVEVLPSVIPYRG